MIAGQADDTLHVSLGRIARQTEHHHVTAIGQFAEQALGRSRRQRHGKHAVAGALTSVTISLEHDYGVYVEPNVWVHHAL